MKTGVLIAVLLYEFISIFGVAFVLLQKAKREKNSDFVLGGRSLNSVHVGVTLALTMLGAAHIWGASENAFGMGAGAMYFGLAVIVMICVVCLVTGPWIRKLKVSTTPELTGMLFGPKYKFAVTCVMAPLLVAMLSLETQCVAVTINVLTGWSYQVGAIIGGIIGIAYVILAGMKEISWLNIINCIVMYVAVVIAIIALGLALPGGWQGVSDAYVASGNEAALTLLGDPSLILSFFLPTAIGVSFFHGISQMGMQAPMAAKDTKTIRRALLVCLPINGLFCVFTVAMGMAAKTLPQFAEYGAMMSTPEMIITLLPNWVVWLLLAAFLGALLSTFAMCCLCPATLFAKDLYRMAKPDMTPKEETRMVRVGIAICGILAVAVSNFQPHTVTAINWIFSWMGPVFIMVVIGLWWKRSAVAAGVTTAVGWIVNGIWTLTPVPAAIGLGGLNNVYATILASLILAIVLTAALPGKPGYFKELKENKLNAKTQS